MYRVEGLSISRKGRPIFRDASCTVCSGEVLGLVAPNGMGKTTLLRFLAGAWALGSASAVTLGNDRVRDPKSLGRHVFYVSGDRSPLYPGLSPRQHLQAVGRIWGVPVDVGGWVERCGMGGYADVPVRRLSRADAGALRPVMEPVDARELVCDVLEDLDMVADGEGVSVSLDDPGTLRGETDERMLTAMVTNLVTNAIRHASERVWVSVAAEEGALRVVVANDGETLSPESAARAFDRFYRGEGGSCGLGLSVVAAYATALGGEVSLGVEEGLTVARLTIAFNGC